MTDLTVRKPRLQDVTAVVGMLAVMEGEIRVSQRADDLPDWMSRLGERLTRSGLLGPEPSLEELSIAVGDLNQRLRYVLGEYDDEDQSP